MTKEIYELATQRGTGLPYLGAVTPKEAYALLQSNHDVHLIDVRTNAERDWVGQVQIHPSQLHAVQWNLYPTQTNPNFIEELNNQVKKTDVLLFLCRSGARSRAAAEFATQHGYAQSYDILEGFEGDKDNLGHRKNVNGWCHAGLPWRGA